MKNVLVLQDDKGGNAAAFFVDVVAGEIRIRSAATYDAASACYIPADFDVVTQTVVARGGGFAMPKPDRCPECAHPETEHVTYSEHESHPLAGMIVCAAQMRGGCQCRRPARARTIPATR